MDEVGYPYNRAQVVICTDRNIPTDRIIEVLDLLDSHISKRKLILAHKHNSMCISALASKRHDTV